MSKFRILTYLTEKGFLPRVYENLAEVQAELRPQKLRLKTMEKGAIWRTINPTTGEVISIDGIKDPTYHLHHSPVLQAVMQLLIVLVLLDIVYNIVVHGIIFKEIAQSLLLCGLFLLAQANVRLSMIAMFVFGGMPLFFLLYLVFSDEREHVGDFLSMTYYGLLFIGNLFFLACAWLTFRNRYDICIVYPDGRKGVYLKYSSEVRTYFGV